MNSQRVDLGSLIKQVLTSTSQPRLTIMQVVRSIPEPEPGRPVSAGAVHARLTRWAERNELPEGWELDWSVPRSICRVGLAVTPYEVPEQPAKAEVRKATVSILSRMFEARDLLDAEFGQMKLDVISALGEALCMIDEAVPSEQDDAQQMVALVWEVCRQRTEGTDPS